MYLSQCILSTHSGNQTPRVPLHMSFLAIRNMSHPYKWPPNRPSSIKRQQSKGWGIISQTCCCQTASYCKAIKELFLHFPYFFLRTPCSVYLFVQCTDTIRLICLSVCFSTEHSYPLWLRETFGPDLKRPTLHFKFIRLKS